MSLLGELFPVAEKKNLTCHLCGRDVFFGEEICDDCKKRMPYNDKTVCLVCGRAIKDEGVCMECKAIRPVPYAMRSAFIYEGDARKLVLTYKNGNRYLSEYLSDELLPVYKKNFFDTDFLTYVPMYIGDEKIRGFNQSAALAAALSEKTGVELRRFIIKTKRTKRQKTLTLKQRRKNLTDCFKIADRSFKGKVVTIVDDVLTTGATADAMAAMLKDHGAKKVYLLTVASVAYKKDDENSRSR